MFFADFGADVFSVEHGADGSGNDRPGFAVWNRGKTRVAIDRGDPAQAGRLTELLLGADICVVRHLDELETYGIDASRLMHANPRLVLLVLPPYARSTPWAGGDESHALLSAAGGVAWRQSSTDGGPIDLRAPVLLYMHGLWATACVVAALVERESSGYGQMVRVCGLHSVLLTAAGVTSVNPDTPDVSTAVGVGGRHPTYTRYLSADGRWIACGALGGKFESRLLEALGLGHVLDDPRIGGRVENIILASNVDWVRALVAASFGARGSEDLLCTISALGIPCGVVGRTQDWLDHPQVRAIGMRHDLPDAAAGHESTIGVPVVLTATPGRVRPPAADQHWSAVRTRPAPPARPAIAPIRPGPLSGYRAIDLGTFVAGPYAGSLLAELGADVIKIEPPSGDPFRQMGFVYNRGMRSLALDLGTQDGVNALHAVVRGSDLVIDTLRPGVSAKLGVDHDRLAAEKPDIVTVSVSAFGETGPLAGLPGVDMVIQAMSGMMTHQGDLEEPVASTNPVIDVATATMTVLGGLIALFHRKRTGRGQRVWTSLVAAATYLQVEELLRYDGRPPLREGEPNHRGDDGLNRFHATRDGWLRIAHPQRDPLAVGRMLDVFGIPRHLALDGQAHLLAQSLAAMTADAAVEAFARCGIAAVRAKRVTEFVREAVAAGEDFIDVLRASDGSFFVVPGRLANFSRTPRGGPMPVPGIGQHSIDVLTEAGVTPETVAQLLAAGVATAGGPWPQKLFAAYR